MMENYLTTANTILYCREWDETVRFYRDRLKLPVLFSTDWFVEYGLNAMSRLSIANEKRTSIKGVGGKGITIALQVHDIEAVREYAIEVGANPSEIKTHPWNARVFYLHDPEGHRIELWQSCDSKTSSLS